MIFEIFNIIVIIGAEEYSPGGYILFAITGGSIPRGARTIFRKFENRAAPAFPRNYDNIPSGNEYISYQTSAAEAFINSGIWRPYTESIGTELPIRIADTPLTDVSHHNAIWKY